MSIIVEIVKTREDSTWLARFLLKFSCKSTTGSFQKVLSTLVKEVETIVAKEPLEFLTVSKRLKFCLS
ncbi:MAG: hypothetical protein ACKD6N_03860 [Candidatus Bathyarchaeota archaeon]